MDWLCRDCRCFGVLRASQAAPFKPDARIVPCARYRILSQAAAVNCCAGKWPNLYSQTTYNIEKLVRFFYLSTSELNWRPSRDEVRGLGVASCMHRLGSCTA